MWKRKNQKLSLNGIEIQASHGVYSSEKKSKSKFRLDIDLWADYHKAMKSDDLDDTLDYQLVHSIVKDEMKKDADLIEHVAYRIIDKIEKIDFPIKKVRVSIKKLSPPLDGFVGDTQFEVVSRLISDK